MTDFDTFVDRRNTDSVKWDRYRDTDIIPLWVADMESRRLPWFAMRSKVAFGTISLDMAMHPAPCSLRYSAISMTSTAGLSNRNGLCGCPGLLRVSISLADRWDRRAMPY